MARKYEFAEKHKDILAKDNSIKFPLRFFTDERYNKLGPRAKILYAYLLSLEEDESGAIYCSRYKVAELFNCDYRTAKNTIEELIEKKLLKQEFTKIGYSLKLYLL